MSDIDELAKIKILNVDDNEASLYTKSRILRRANFEVREAMTGNQALWLAAEEKPRLILLDVHLPDINGFEVCRRIKTDPRLASTLILQISASAVQGTDKTFGLENGADGYLVEPVEPDELVANVMALLRLREAEESLREANERLNAVLSSITEAYFVLDADWRFLEINPAAEQLIFKQPAGELVGKVFWEAYPQTVETEFYQEFQQAVAEGESHHFECHARIVDKWFEAHAYPRKGVLEVYLRDITEQKQAQQAQYLLAQVGGVLDSSLDYTVTLQAVTKLVLPLLGDYCNIYIVEGDDRIRRVAQAHRDPQKEAWLHDLSNYAEFEVSNPRTIISRVVRTGKAELLLEVTEAIINEALFPDDELRAMVDKLAPKSAVVVPLIARGQMLGVISLVYAESGRRYSPADLRLAEELSRRVALAVDNARLYHQAQRLNAELEQKVLERTAELEQSVKELNQFVFVASHDLKAPLRGIDLLATWVLQDAGDVLPEPSRVHLTKLQGRIKRLEMLLNDLLVYSRVGHHYYQNMEIVDTGALVKEIVDLLAPPPNFIITIQDDLPKLATRRILLELVFRSLIGNAIKHHHRSDGHIQVSAREDENFIEFSVTDDGPGIDEAFHERIFEVFQVLQPRDQLEGSGIGLAIVKRTVENQGGVVRVISAEGQGTTFQFTWPKKFDPIAKQQGGL